MSNIYPLYFNTITNSSGQDGQELAAPARVALFHPDPQRLSVLIKKDFPGSKVLFRSANEILATFTGLRFISDVSAFQFSRLLRDTYDLIAAEPEIEICICPGDYGDRTDTESAGDLLGCWADAEPGLAPDWPLVAMRVREAWALSEGAGRPSRGAGIVVAQPDTGVTPHDELDGVPFVAPHNLLNGRPDDPTDPLEDFGNPGHGTATSSVAVSPASHRISGTAPKARLMPIRTIRKVWLVSQIRVAQAIDHAVDNGAHVVTLSLGGLPSLTLHAALDRATAAGVIVMAAAGNCVREVVFPARYRNCIAVAGTDSQDGIWVGSCRGADVDFSAPAQNVYRATAPNKGVAQGQGTSYAVALTAGAAACWLAHHGRANLIAEAARRRETLTAMFRRLVRATARVPAGWNPRLMGAGILDLAALLAADLDLGRGSESAFSGIDRPEDAVRSLALARLGGMESGSAEDALPEWLDWYRDGTEIGLALFANRRLPGAPSAAVPPDPPPPPPPADGAKAILPPDSAAAADAKRTVRAADHDQAMPDWAQHQARLLVARDRVERGDKGSMRDALESADDAPFSQTAADATLDRIMAIADRMPKDEIRDRAQFVAALNLLHRKARPLLRGLVGGAASGPSPADRFGLEAIVIADGSRPSFLIQDGKPPVSHPFMGDWGKRMEAAQASMITAAASIGRIQPENGHANAFIGTGVVVNADQGLVLTNYHVVEDAQIKAGILMKEMPGNKLKVVGHLEIDFKAEANRMESCRFRVVEVWLPPGAGPGFGWIDCAVLKVEPIGAVSLPARLPLNAGGPYLSQTRFASLATIGFPAKPRIEHTGADIDWGFVVDTLFGGLFGVKRLAPGYRMGAVGDAGADSRKICFDHDATTFRGASGSPLLAWEAQTVQGFGLHFRGINGESNSAIAFERVRDDLAALGVIFEDQPSA